MKAIWKYPIVTDSQRLAMPRGAEFLTVQRQGDLVCLWAIVDDSRLLEKRVIEVFGTGNPMPSDMGIERKYIGTFQQGPLVWHVFERIN